MDGADRPPKRPAAWCSAYKNKNRRPLHVDFPAAGRKVCTFVPQHHPDHHRRRARRHRALGNAAGFLEDSKASLETRNFYMNRDFRDGPGQSKREEWAQGFILNLQSGYTQGTVGFGLDAMGMLGVKLDSGRGRSGTGLLPKDSDGRAPDTYSKLGLTAKVKVSQSELKVGTLIPKLPSVQPNNGRIFPQIFEGALLTSKEIKDLGFTAGRLEKTKIRDSSDSEDLALNDKNGRFAGVSADHFDLGGLDYKLTDQLTASYHYSNLQDVYRQHFVGLLHSWPIGPGELTSDLRFARSTDSGSAKAGGIDNKSLNGMFTYSLGNHAFGAAWQRMNGDDAFPTSKAATRTWSTSSRSTTSPAPRSVPGNCATTTTSSASAFPA